MKITVDRLNFRYPGTEKAALKNLGFSVAKGEIFGLLGPSGAGKSTTLGVLTGTLGGWSGTVQVGTTNPAGAGAGFYRQIGVCFESPRFHNRFTAAENLRLFGSLYGTALRDSKELMSRLGLGNDMKKKVEAYSKGMKTRLSLVRALQHNPSLLFLDEPTNGLDPGLTRSVCDLILEERDRGKTIFLTTHDMQTASLLCDRVGFLSEGELAVVDAPSELALQYGIREVRVEGTRETRSFPMDHLVENREFLDFLAQADLRTIHSREAGLDDIFRQVTGKVLS